MSHCIWVKIMSHCIWVKIMSHCIWVKLSLSPETLNKSQRTLLKRFKSVPTVYVNGENFGNCWSYSIECMACVCSTTVASDVMNH